MREALAVTRHRLRPCRAWAPCWQPRSSGTSATSAASPPSTTSPATQAAHPGRLQRRQCPPTAQHRRNRALNSVLHIIAVCQICDSGRGQEHYLCKNAEGETPAAARRVLKRRLSNVVYRIMKRDHGTTSLKQPYTLIRLAVSAPVYVAEQPVVAGRGVRAEPVADIHGQHDPGPSSTLGSGRPVSMRRNRVGSSRPGPMRRTGPRAPRCSTSRQSSTRVFTGPSAHKIASVRSKSASARRYRQS